MKEPDYRYLVRLYIYLAATSVMMGVGITVVMLYVCAYFEINIMEHLWIVVLPVLVAVTLNIIFVELFRKSRKH